MVALLAALLCILLVAPASAAGLNEMSLERWGKLRETERYQLQIAEKYFRDKDYKVALNEYEKYLTLYERSEAAPYAQLKWSLCLVQRRQLNTAIKDGFQSVIDYWPESPEAVAAAYYIGNTYKGMGELGRAKKAYAALLSDHPQHLAATLARVDLADIARIEGDERRRVELWRELTFDTRRTRDTARSCEDASRALATHYFNAAAFAQGREALATTYSETDLPPQVVSHVRGPVSNLTGNNETKAAGEKLADETVAFLMEAMPTDLADEAQKARARQYWFSIADVQGASRRAAEVPKVYEKMGQLFGIDDEILGRLAGWFRGQNRRDEARATYMRFADKIEGRNQVAAMFREEKKYDQAVTIYRALSAEDQDRFARWLSEVAGTYYQAGKVEECVGVYQQLIKDDPENSQRWLWSIATTYRDYRRYKEAIATFRLCENFPENYKQMAACHRQLKQYNEALALYHQVLGGHEPSAPWAQLQIGYTYEEAGKKENAISSFQRVCSRYPKTAQASQSHAHLQNKYNINTGGGAKQGADDK